MINENDGLSESQRIALEKFNSLDASRGNIEKNYTDENNTEEKFAKPAKKNRYRWTVLLVGITVTGAIALAGQSLMRAPDSSGAVDAVATVPSNDTKDPFVTKDDLREQITIVGKIIPSKFSNVSARTSGIIEEVLVVEGQIVKQGDIVAKLESRHQRIQLELARANLELAKEHLKETQLTLAVVEKEFERANALADRQLISEADLDEIIARADQAKSEVKSAKSSIEVAELQIQSNEHALEYTVIRAPFGGLVSEVFVNEGESISPILSGGISTKPGVCTIVDPASMQVEVDVDEEYFEFVQQSQHIEVTIPALPTTKATAVIKNISTTIDAAQGTFKVTATLDAEGKTLLSNMAARVTFNKGDLALALGKTHGISQ